MLEPYWGEFLVSPLALELSLGACGRCAYCFARLNEPRREAKLQAVLNLLRDFPNRETYTAHLLREGYPVEFSNKSDPFSPNNAEAALAILRICAAVGVPVAVSTKGGKAAEEAASILPPSVWYISVSSLSEEYRQAVEPGAPSIAERFRLMSALRARGHRVQLGLNPCLPEWCPEPAALLRRAQGAGAESVWVEPLHVSGRQAGNLTEAQRAAIGEEVLKRAGGRTAAPEVRAHVLRAREEAQALGLPVYTSGQPTPSPVWRAFRECYPRTFPTAQDVVNWCAENKGAGDTLTFSEWTALLLPSLPAGKWPVDSYLVAARHDPRAPVIPPQLTFRQILWLVWQNHKQPSCPARMPCFAFASRGGEPVVDGEGLPVLAWVPEGTGEWYQEVP